MKCRRCCRRLTDYFDTHNGMRVFWCECCQISNVKKKAEAEAELADAIGELE